MAPLKPFYSFNHREIMNLRFLLSFSLLFALACTSTEDVSCLDNPEEEICAMPCAEDPMLDWCVCLQARTNAACDAVCARNENASTSFCQSLNMDGGTDARDAGDTSDAEVDAPPCNGDCAADRCINDECVGCLEDGECTTASASRCDNDGDSPTYQCVGCLISDDCMGIAEGGLCVPAGRPMAGTCVACLGTTDCTTAGEVCHVPGEDQMQENWMGNYTCVATPQVNVCEECISDEQCMTGFTCAPLYFDDSGTPIAEGYVCLPTSETAPFLNLETVTTRNGVVGTEVRLLRTGSCQAFQHYSQGGRGGTSCDNAGTPVDENCGLEGTTADAVCRPISMNSTTFLCTTRCAGMVDCRSSRACIDDPESADIDDLICTLQI